MTGRGGRESEALLSACSGTRDHLGFRDGTRVTDRVLSVSVTHDDFQGVPRSPLDRSEMSGGRFAQVSAPATPVGGTR